MVYSKKDYIEEQIAIFEKKLPNIMRVENISVCNEACYFCPYPMSDGPKGFMDEKLYHKILTEHKEGEGDKIIYPATLGEPTLSKALPRWVRIARDEYNYSEVHVFTNSTNLKQKMAEELIDAGLTGIMFTLHGLTKENFIKITKFKRYEIVVNNIKNFINLNYRNRSPVKIYLTIYASFNKNFIENHEFVIFSKEMGVTVSIHSMENLHNWAGTFNLGKAQLHAEIPCKRIWTQFGVTYQGDVVLCAVDYKNSLKLGNVKNDTLKNIIKGAKYREVKRIHLEGRCDELEGLCKNCTARLVDWRP